MFNDRLKTFFNLKLPNFNLNHFVLCLYFKNDFKLRFVLSTAMKPLAKGQL